MSIQSRIISLTATQLGLGEDEISLDSNFMDDLGADSLDTVALVMDLEDEFTIEISDLEAADIITVEQATTFIKERLNG